MVEEKQIDSVEQSPLRMRAIARTRNEGGIVNRFSAAAPESSLDTASAPPLTQTELVQLHIRVIALENLIIALLAEAPDSQLILAREMAIYITPRPGFTPHHLTIAAANEMLSLVNRATPFRATNDGSAS